MNLFSKLVVTAITSALLLVGGIFTGENLYQPVQTQSFGSFSPVQGQTYTLQGAGVTATQNTIPLASFTTPDGRAITMAMFGGTIGYGTLEPNTNSKIEDITFSGVTQNSNGSATLTGVTRGNDFVTPYAASTTLSKAHAGGSYFILSNTAGFYGQQFLFANNTSTSTAVMVFSSTTPPRYDADPIWANFSTQVLADVSYVNSVVAAGAANGSEAVKGIYQLATAAQAALGTSLGSTGARLALGNNLATSTPTVACTSGCVPIAVNGHLSQLFLDLTQLFTFNGGFISQASSTVSANLNVNSFTIQGVAPKFSNFGGTGADGALTCSSGTTNINLAGASAVVKNYTSISITGTCYVEITNGATGGSEVILKSQGNAVFTSSAAPMLDASTTGSSGAGGISGGAQSGVTAPSSAAFSSIAGGTGGIGGGNSAGGGASAPTTFAYYPFSNVSQTPYQNIFVGSGGGSGGCAGSAPTCKGGNGGNGGGAVIVEVGGALNFTTANGISVAGQNGTSTGSISGGSNVIASGGGGGGGGFFMLLYNSLTALTGTVNVSGGTGSLGVTSGSPSSINGGGGGANPISNGSTGSNGGTGAGSAGGTGGAGYSLIGQNPK